MTLTDELKIHNEKFKTNQAQYDLNREASKIPVLFSRELDQYEYLTGEDLEYKTEVLEIGKFEYSPLGEVLGGKVKKKTDRMVKKDKQNKNLVYNQQDSFAKFKSAGDFTEMLLDSMYKKWINFIKHIIDLKTLVQKQTKTKV